MDANLDDKLAYLQQAKAHADEGPLGEPAARSILEIAEEATRRARRLAQTVYIHMPENEIRKSLPFADAEWVLSRRGGVEDYEPPHLTTPRDA